jgi:hypothetical protein
MPGWVHLPNWKTTCAYDAMAARGHDAIAWEVLRRDPLYRSFAAAAADGDQEVMTKETVRRWGLHFP